ncbi:hypothetical protein AK812_SmicGene20270 [Symbiodinium microadriaticum]|uniref:Uncharacterized protein n=1 Tax=Symbiodinium microadriaticum TaxID=2951 RepID=A0A1Q9DQE6_SYMMI|nr:hypothetical protein AK812_SmicGene20270 [Symbiodinium microadriaticum]
MQPLCSPRTPARASSHPGLPRGYSTRVVRNMRLADMNHPVPVADARWIEIVCNGLPYLAWGHLSCRCHLHRTRDCSGESRPDSQPGLAQDDASLPRALALPLWFSLSRQEAAVALNPQPFCGSSHKHAASPSARLFVRWSGIIAAAAQRVRASSLLELHLVGMVPHMPGPLLEMELCCKWQSVANYSPTPSSLRGGGAQSLCVLGCDIGGRWKATAMARAITALGRACAVPGPAKSGVPALDEVLALAPADPISRPPLR